MIDIKKYVQMWRDGRTMVVQAEGKGWTGDGDGCDWASTTKGYAMMQTAEAALNAAGFDEFGGTL